MIISRDNRNITIKFDVGPALPNGFTMDDVQEIVVKLDYVTRSDNCLSLGIVLDQIIIPAMLKNLRETLEMDQNDLFLDTL